MIDLSQMSKKQRRRWLRHNKRPKLACTVYTLRRDPDGPIYYVGQTRCQLHIRLEFHIQKVFQNQHADRKDSPIQAWIRSMLKEGKPVLIQALDENGVWDVSEAVWIDRLLAKGEPLLNVNGVVPRAPT